MEPVTVSDTMAEMIAKIVKTMNESPNNIPWTYCCQPYDPEFNEMLRNSHKGAVTKTDIEGESEPLLPV